VAWKQTRLFPELRGGNPETTEEAQNVPDAAEEVPGRGQEGHRTKPPQQDWNPGVNVIKLFFSLIHGFFY
jgi:hypothetical protein